MIANRDLFYIHNIIGGVPIHLGQALAWLIWNETKRSRTRDITTGPYITRQIWAIRLLRGLPQMWISCLMITMSMDTL